jgi:hypothetical protein
MREGTAIGRLAALRRKLGALVSPPRWLARAKARRLARLEAALARALPLDPALTPEPAARRDPDRLG